MGGVAVCLTPRLRRDPQRPLGEGAHRAGQRPDPGPFERRRHCGFGAGRTCNATPEHSDVPAFHHEHFAPLVTRRDDDLLLEGGPDTVRGHDPHRQQRRGRGPTGGRRSAVRLEPGRHSARRGRRRHKYLGTASVRSASGCADIGRLSWTGFEDRSSGDHRSGEFAALPDGEPDDGVYQYSYGLDCDGVSRDIACAGGVVRPDRTFSVRLRSSGDVGCSENGDEQDQHRHQGREHRGRAKGYREDEPGRSTTS